MARSTIYRHICVNPTPNHSPKEPPNSVNSFVTDKHGKNDSVIATVWSNTSITFVKFRSLLLFAIKAPWICKRNYFDLLFSNMRSSIGFKDPNL